jgi:MoxR-like ATPase
VTEPRDALGAVREQVAKAVIGQEQVVSGLLAALLVRGHVILEGVPGVAKTLLVKALARSLDLQFRRVQLAPDLMPSDVTGNVVYEGSTGEFRFRPGPVFTNLLLADEINRTPPKTQAAMLEAMQERQISAGGERHRLPAPFFVLATQNPLDQEGTYPLPEAQLDRFLLHIKVGYPNGSDEWEIARRVTSGQLGSIEPCMSGDEILELQELVKRVPVSDQVLGYAWALVRASRPGTDEAPEFVNQWVSWGAGPRGLITLILCAKSRAALNGRHHATVADVEAVAKPALRHRVAGNYAAQAKHLNSEKLIEMLLDAVPTDKRYEPPVA